MRESLKLNRRSQRFPLKPIKRKCSSVIKITKLVSAILVPLMIGAFTIVTTLQESKRSQLQRDADMAKIERQAQLQQEAETRQRQVDALKIKEQQERDDTNTKETRIQNIYDTFMRDISSIVLKDNINLTIPEILFARAKTSFTLEQIDARRKWYLIKFLYDSRLLYGNKSGMRYVDLAGVDLSNVKFGTEKQFARRIDLQGIRLSRLQLRNSSFENIGLNQANFEFSALNHLNFISISMAEANFKETILENSKFVISSLQESSFKNSKLKLSSWSSISTTEKSTFSHIDFSNCDLSESIFQGLSITNNLKFDQANFERIIFSNMKFSAKIIFNNLNMRMSRFIDVRLTDVTFRRCNMVGAIFEKSHFRNVLFDNVDLQQSQFDYTYDSGNIQFTNVHLIGSNLNITWSRISQIIDSVLPKGTFETSFKRFGMNLIQNADAEQGQCNHSNRSSILTVLHGWLRHGDIVQIYYNKNDSKMNILNYTNDWQSCFFFGGNLHSKEQSKLNEHILRQEINIQQSSVLVNLRQARFNASAYLGGFEDEQSSTVMTIGFKNTQNKTEFATVGKVTNVDRQNKTTMLFRSTHGMIPNDTILIDIELKFQRHLSRSAFRLGMADNLKFVIQQK